MQIDLSWLKLHPKDTDRFHLEKMNVEMDDGAPSVDQVVVDLEVTNTGRLMVGKGEIKAQLEFQCDRCLNPFSHQVELPFTVEFCSEDNRHYYKNEETFIYFDEPRVDIEPVVRENILLSLPLRTLCSPECKGLCSICGVDRNLAPCNCQEKEADPRWEALKKML